jgi:hypothetical protein
MFDQHIKRFLNTLDGRTGPIQDLYLQQTMTENIRDLGIICTHNTSVQIDQYLRLIATVMATFVIYNVTVLNLLVP